jgi:hypothetical protein
MARVEKEKAAEIGAFLSRYMSARCRCVGATVQRGRIGLAYLLQHGVRRFDEIHIEPEANPPIVRDGKHDAFFRAIIMRDDEAMAGLPDLRAWRNYVHDSGPVPQRPARAPAVSETSPRS